MVDGQETVGNSSGKASMGGCDETEATTGWTDGKFEGVRNSSWAELRWEGATQK